MSTSPKRALLLVTEDGKLSAEVPNNFYAELEISILARTIWGEARGEGEVVLEALASVITNRAAIAEKRGKYWWGNNIIQICQKPYQFDCWNRSRPEFKSMLGDFGSDPYFGPCDKIARAAVAGDLKDRTGGATHYHKEGYNPYWAKGETPSATIGEYVFYKMVSVESKV